MKPWGLYRQALLRGGYGVQVSRHTEQSRLKATAGRRVASYTVRLLWPDGRRSRHTAPDSLTAAYRAACAATPEGVPEIPVALLRAGPDQGDAPLRVACRDSRTAQVGAPPSLFDEYKS
ncbi:hypothetical protein IHN32_03395 [Deinococcus sp. 14RED07]|uniref:hypothetical protein n=1 Tax=Deinococcus sp. 14RED07 TaxID=2745874 RepID=UPI001E3789C8|nr:hypothetical protein [Deinococcus sp. 14RED07]MCD0174995.1 hypothetical protein [Deinococcus sp. 14RED07]